MLEFQVRFELNLVETLEPWTNRNEESTVSTRRMLTDDGDAAQLALLRQLMWEIFAILDAQQ